MGKIGFFFKVMGKSMTDPEYYKELIKAPFSFSMKYFLLLCFFLSSFFVIVIFAAIIPGMQEFFDVIKKNAESVFPSGLEVTVENGQVSTNKQEPVLFPLQEEVDGIENLVVIDTTAEVDALDDYNTFMLITQDAISFRDNQKITTYPLDDIEGSTTINQQTFEDVINQIKPFFDIAVPIIATLLFVGYIFFFFVFNFILVLFYSLIAWIVGAIMKLQQGYGKMLQLTLHATTGIIVIRTFLFYSGVSIPIPFLFEILFIVFMVMVIRKIKEGSGEMVKKA